MTDHKFTDDEVIKALDICDKFDFFYGQRAGRELWFEKPVEIQNKDVRDFAEGIAFVKDIISHQKAEIERLNKEVDRLSQCVLYHDGIVSDLERDLFNAKAEAIKEFAKKIKTDAERICDDNYIEGALIKYVDTLVKEMTEGKNESQSTKTVE